MTQAAAQMTTLNNPRCRPLPPEIWINIFSFHDDLKHLWLTCRRVSSTLRACAEHAFGEFYLSQVYIDFQLEKHNLGGRTKRPEVSVVFDRLGRGKESGTAYFIATNVEPPSGNARRKRAAQEQYDRVMERWKEHVEISTPELPNYTITIGDMVNDTALPNLGIDIKRREIHCEWRQMLIYFYREVTHLRLLKAEWHISAARQLKDIHSAKLPRGERLGPVVSIPQWTSDEEVETFKEVRRARLREHYKTDEEMLWAIDSLAQFESASSSIMTTKAYKLLLDLPGARLGEKWFGHLSFVQRLYLDEWNCMQRMEIKREELRKSKG